MAIGSRAVFNRLANALFNLACGCCTIDFTQQQQCIGCNAGIGVSEFDRQLLGPCRLNQATGQEQVAQVKQRVSHRQSFFCLNVCVESVKRVHCYQSMIRAKLAGH